MTQTFALVSDFGTKRFCSAAIAFCVIRRWLHKQSTNSELHRRKAKKEENLSPVCDLNSQNWLIGHLSAINFVFRL